MNRFEPRVLVACEYSGTVRDAFLDRGFDAYSCDLLPDENGETERHFQCDVREVLDLDWDLIIVAHPPCTRLCNSGVRWLSKPPEGKTLEQMWQELEEGCELFSTFLNAPCPRIAIENPVMHKHAKERIEGFYEATQWIQPYEYGHAESKKTGLWLKGLPKLEPTDVVEGEIEQRVHRMAPGPNRWKERSRFFSGIADAMAKQWGEYAEAEMMKEQYAA